MSEPAIHVQGLGKQYRLGTAAGGGLLAALKRRFRPKSKGSEAPGKADTFWAIQDLNFKVEPGEIVGIIGRNGAGKSTLLKILSRITPPTTGRALINGRVASLLEVGTGFHPELSGRDNIFLNGAILGMRRSEIITKFDEIVSFAEVERFIDTPVKHYSSGMYVRLAFAVAAHLEPEILIIDEVLAVGDAAFQEKCLGKMDSIARKGGRTILFVSHNTAAVRNLCRRAILLENGVVAMDGQTEATLTRYLDLHSKADAPALARLQKGSSPLVNCLRLSLRGNPLSAQVFANPSAPLDISLSFDCHETIKASLELRITDRYGARIALSSPGFEGMNASLHVLPAGRHTLSMEITLPALVKGVYHLDVLLLQPYVCNYAVFQQAFELHLDGSGQTWEKYYDASVTGHMLLPSIVKNTSA